MTLPEIADNPPVSDSLKERITFCSWLPMDTEPLQVDGATVLHVPGHTPQKESVRSSTIACHATQTPNVFVCAINAAYKGTVSHTSDIIFKVFFQEVRGRRCTVPALRAQAWI